MQGFSLHAAVRCEAEDRQGLERLCGHITRPALACERVQCDAAGRVVLKLNRTSWFRARAAMLRYRPGLRPLVLALDWALGKAAQSEAQALTGPELLQPFCERLASEPVSPSCLTPYSSERRT